MSFLDSNKKSNVEVYCICYNEEVLLPYFIKHYYKNFKANITIYDNHSTDNSVKIAKDMGCSVKSFDTNNQIRDDAYLNIKNNVWKNSKADWVIVCDIDEFLEAPFNCDNYSILNVTGYEVVGPFFDSRLGVINPAFNKNVMFRPNEFKEINYSPGCHSCNPIGNISGSLEMAKLLHRKWLSPEYVYRKHLVYESRLSDFNKKHAFGKEYEGTNLQYCKDKFEAIYAQAKQIPTT